MITDRITQLVRRVVSHQSNVGKWDNYYKGLQQPRPYDDEMTYKLAADFLNDMQEVEDWGCGSGGFVPFCRTRYIGIDGSRTPFANKIVDLCHYRSRADGILLKHVLKHDYRWRQILENAVASFQRKLCIILFTPFSEKTHTLHYDYWNGIPDISFDKDELVACFDTYRWTLDENMSTRTQYGVEHVFYIQK